MSVRPPALLLTLLAAALAAAAALWFTATPPPPPAGDGAPVLVLPFDNPADDESLVAVADGLTGELISRLSAIPGLKVIARNSAYAFLDEGTDPQGLREAARRVGAGAVVDGSLTASDDSFAVGVRLVDAATGETVWSCRRTFGLGGFFEVRAELADSIAVKRGIAPAAGRDGRPPRAESTDPGAVRQYLGGRDALASGTTASALTGAGRFASAVALDPAFAAAHAGMASCYALAASRGSTAEIRDTAAARARDAARAAIALDSTLAEPHAALASVLFRPGWKFAEAGARFRRAIRLDPGNAEAGEGYGLLLTVLGKQDEAITEFRTAGELDPLSIGALTGIGKALYFRRSFDASVEAYRRAVGEGPSDEEAHLGLAMSCAAAGNYHDAVEAVNEAIDAGGGADALAVLGYVYAKRGDRASAIEILDRFRSPGEGAAPSPYNAALVLAGLGSASDAISFLERALAERDVRLPWLGVDPAWDGLRNDPRFAELLANVGLPG